MSEPHRQSDAPPPSAPGDPYCSNCGYSLIGATESSKCPECGMPLVDVLARRGGVIAGGKRFRSKSQVFGMPVVHIAIGPSVTERRGKARGFIAIGDDALGVLAIGGAARGVLAIGGAAIGVFSLGGASVGLGAAAGGWAIGGLAAGGGALGGLVWGGGAAGYAAEGGGAAGVYARGGGVFARHAITPTTQDPAAVTRFKELSWFFGPWRGPGTVSFQPPAMILMIDLAVALLIAVIALWAVRRAKASHTAPFA